MDVLKTALLLCQIVLLQGEVLIELSNPSSVKTGSNVMLKCILSNFFDDATPESSVLDSTCHIIWSKSYYTASHGQLYQEALVNSNIVIITRTEDKWNRPKQSTVMLRNVDPTDDGHYKCSVVCHNRIESASMQLRVDRDGWHFWSADGGTMVSAVLTVVVICFILFIAVCLAAKPRCLKCPSTATETHDSEDTESTLLESVSSDPPPRYSLVINTSQGPSGSHSSIGGLTLQRNLSYTGSIDSVFLVPLTNAPPDYSTALMYLAEKGVIFNPNSLKPMPPSYKDALNFPLKS